VTVIPVDEMCVNLQPECVKTFAPRGQTPVIDSPARRTRLQVIIGITPTGELAYRMQTKSFSGAAHDLVDNRRCTAIALRTSPALTFKCKGLGYLSIVATIPGVSSQLPADGSRISL